MTENRRGTLVGIGVGPGNPGLMTVAGAEALGRATHVFTPRAGGDEASLALSIAERYINPRAEIAALDFPMLGDKTALSAHWRAAAERVTAAMTSGNDCCFITLGDPMLYSTYVYLAREVKVLLPDAVVKTIPGITSVSAASALAGFPLGEGGKTITIVPGAADEAALERALDGGGTVVVMKIGRRLGEVMKLLGRRGLLGKAVLASRVGREGERLLENLERFNPDSPEVGYMSILLVDAGV